MSPESSSPNTSPASTAPPVLLRPEHGRPHDTSGPDASARTALIDEHTADHPAVAFVLAGFSPTGPRPTSTDNRPDRPSRRSRATTPGATGSFVTRGEPASVAYRQLPTEVRGKMT
jgi:hypothetical protein